MLDGVDGDDRNMDCSLDVLGEVLFPAFSKGVGLDDGPTGLICAAADVQAGDAETLEVASDMQALFLGQAVLKEFIAIHTDRDREVRAAGEADTDDDLGKEAHAVEEVSAILVGSLVGMRRKELVDQIAVRGVNLDTVKAGGLDYEANPALLVGAVDKAFKLSGTSSGTISTASSPRHSLR